MQRHDSTLGRCPRCGDAIDTHHVLISYDTDTGTEHFAECPGCRDVVHPRVE